MTVRLAGLKRSATSTVSMLIVLTISTATLVFGASHASAQDYVRNSSVSYDLRDAFGHPHPRCRGFAFIGQTVSNTIEAYSTVRCTGNGILATASTTTSIKHEPGTLTHIAQRLDKCVDCGFVVASVSTRGAGPGTRFCVQGSGHFFTPIQGNGTGTTCIVT
jgi:hypothetical protein